MISVVLRAAVIVVAGTLVFFVVWTGRGLVSLSLHGTGL
jgi:hypothetical protein